MVFGKKKEVSPPLPPEKETPTITASDKHGHKPNPIVEPEPEPSKEEARLTMLLQDINERYAVYTPEHFSHVSESTNANLLIAIYGELYDVNENLATLIKVIQSMK